jgi:hypothetical protein
LASDKGNLLEDVYPLGKSENILSTGIAETSEKGGATLT